MNDTQSHDANILTNHQTNTTHNAIGMARAAPQHGRIMEYFIHSHCMARWPHTLEAIEWRPLLHIQRDGECVSVCLCVCVRLCASQRYHEVRGALQLPLFEAGNPWACRLFFQRTNTTSEDQRETERKLWVGPKSCRNELVLLDSANNKAAPPSTITAV